MHYSHKRVKCILQNFKTRHQVSYIVAMDVWMVMSLVFIVLAMIETVFVSWMYQKGEQSEAAVSQ